MDQDQKRKIKREKMWSYTLLYLFVALTNIPFFIGNEYLMLLFVFSLFLFIFKEKRIDQFIVNYCLIFLFIFLVQSLFFSVLEINIIFGYILRILYAYFTIRLIGKDIARYFVNIIYFFTLVSFIFFFPTLIFPEVVNTFLEQLAEYLEPLQLHYVGRKHILIYTFGLEYSSDQGMIASSLPRNSGPFWEPGGFGIFLILALMFNLIENKKFFSKKNIVLVIGVLTTLSTGAFIGMFIFIFLYLITYRTPARIISLVIFLIGSGFVYINTFFLREKVTEHLDSANNISLAYAPRTRFVSAQLDLIDFFNNPVLGRGRFVQTRFDVKEDENEILINHRTNGTTNMLVEFGFFGFFTFFFFMYKSFKAFCIANNFKVHFAYYAVIVVIVLGFYEMILIKPFFIGLSFMFLAAGYDPKLKLKA